MIYINNNTDPQMVSIPRGTVAPSSSVTQYATEEYVDNAIEEAISGITGVNYTAGENIDITNDVISVTGMPDTSEFVTSGEVETQINNAISGITGVTYEAGDNIQISGNVISVTGMPDTSEFVTSGDVQTQINDSISGITGGTEYSAGTNIKIEDYVISVTGLPTSNTAFTNDAGYVNSGDVQTQINDSISGITGGSEYSAGTNIEISNNVISVTGITVPTSNTAFTNDAGYITSGDIPTSNTAFTNDAGFVNSGDVQTQIDDSISGITGSSGGEQFVELTKAQYEALTAYSQDTTYIITDADMVDLGGFATTGDVASKADKVTVDANNGNMRFPNWNDQGIITGYSTTTYDRTLTINNSGVTFCGSNDISLFAPTSAGTAGQILQSNGSGAPVWSSFKVWFGTQTQYDAITTKDSGTIYFVKED